MANFQLKGLSTSYTIGDSFASGGEGAIHDIVGQADKVAKIYLPPKDQEELKERPILEKKILYMVKNPPKDKEVLGQMAWPIDVLKDAKGAFQGFVMNRMEKAFNLQGLYGYRTQDSNSLNFQQKLIVAMNICSVLDTIHNAGYVFGDFNHLNISVRKNGKVSVFDTDSFHFTDPSVQTTYRCNVCAPGYVAPELITKSKNFKRSNPNADKLYAQMPLPTFTKETDRFALALHVFRLLMNGYTPYEGIDQGLVPEDVALGSVDKNVEDGLYCFKPGKVHRAKVVPKANEIPPYILTLFNRAFLDGQSNPSKRPTPAEWFQGLNQYANDVIPCAKNPLHSYYKGLKDCPFCAADNRYDQFMAQQKAAYGGGTAQPSMAQQTFQQPVNTVKPPVNNTTRGTPGGTPPPRPTGSTASASYKKSRVSGDLDEMLYYGISVIVSVLICFLSMKYYDFSVFDTSQLESRTPIPFVYNIAEFIAPFLIGFGGVICAVCVAAFQSEMYLEETIMIAISSGFTCIFGMFITYWLIYGLTLLTAWFIYAMFAVIAIAIALTCMAAACGG